MPLVNATKKRLLDALYGNTAVAPAATLYVGLSTTTPTDTGSNFTEPSGGSYARVAVTNNTTNWPGASTANPSVKSNGTEIEFPQATADWATGSNMTHWGVFEASTGGTPVDWAALTTPKPVLNGDTAKFEVGDLVTRLEN
jgi:hypothetical protein